MDALAQILDACPTNHRITPLLVDNIDDEGMKCTLSKRGGRNVVRQFAHLHNVRLWHLENRAPDLSQGLVTFAPHAEPEKRPLKEALAASAEAIATFFTRCVTGEGKARAVKAGVVAHTAYFVAHAAHHRGNVLLTLKQC